MRLRVGPWSIERQHGKPYLVGGYQLEPTAWVIRSAAASVLVPQDGEPAARYWAYAAVRPSTVHVTDPLGRRYTLGFMRRRRLLHWLMAIASVVFAVGAWRLRRHLRGVGRPL